MSIDEIVVRDRLGRTRVAWPPNEEAMVRDLYQKIGPKAIHALIPHRSPLAIRHKAASFGLTAVRAKHACPRPKQVSEPAYPVPTHDYTAADIAVRNWRTVRPVSGVFAPSLGLAA